MHLKACVDGAGICLDDVHGYIGQVELAFAGIEVRARVQLRVERSEGWRVDWPMRWYALGVDYELYGKDLIESFKIGKRIMNRIFRTKEPENMFYEMFLDDSGAKISKSKGKGLTVEEWLKYGTLESLYLLMYRRPRKAKELSFNIIPAYVDDVPCHHAIELGSPHARYAIIDQRGGSPRIEQVAVTYDWEAAAQEAASNGFLDWARWLATGCA